MALTYPKQIRLCEVGLRDGLQNEKKIPTTQEKIAYVNALTEAGFPVIEVGSFVSPKAVPQVADTDEVFKGITQKTGVEYRALIANLKGVDRAIECGCKKVKLNVSASVAHNLANLNCTPAESVARFSACVDRAKEAGIEISGSISMAFGSPWDKEIAPEVVCKIIEAYMLVGIREISLSDASGMAYPSQVASLCHLVKEKYPEVSWWLHFHNTRGLGVANILAGLSEGFTQFDTSMAGMGGCPFVPGAAGNVSSEDVIHMCDEMGIATGIDLDKMMDISRHMASELDHPADSYLLRAGKASDLILDVPTRQAKNHTQGK
ncbi:hydroxymethylglutaryl-CoA lyase [Acidaminococcus sp. AM05-11]|uniref:hydroxymethylglutaryl-CoA lyase n=1 Tax=Acidaminococcus TaxID=904 RepID=UPI000E551BEA|nr:MULTISPECIES: hydroxymethylglutaryl-CoA lyase [Acidaminococcus]RHJ97742.1 hydroxymethylglutaryl-CoA lyase [Acidaminococcus sp. AM05-11]